MKLSSTNPCFIFDPILPQVDALRELSVISLKQDEQRSSMATKCRVVSDELSSSASTPLRGISDLQLHLSILRDGEKTLDKEMGSKEHLGSVGS